MAAYIIAEVTITDPQGFETYRQMVPSTLAKYGGKFVVRGGAMEKLEGSWEPKRLVIIEFDSAERATCDRRGMISEDREGPKWPNQQQDHSGLWQGHGRMLGTGRVVKARRPDTCRDGDGPAQAILG
jgi:uncharacterized protein (DUF1330 family)